MVWLIEYYHQRAGSTHPNILNEAHKRFMSKAHVAYYSILLLSILTMGVAITIT